MESHTKASKTIYKWCFHRRAISKYLSPTMAIVILKRYRKSSIVIASLSKIAIPTSRMYLRPKGVSDRPKNVPR